MGLAISFDSGFWVSFLRSFNLLPVMVREKMTWLELNWIAGFQTENRTNKVIQALPSSDG